MINIRYVCRSMSVSRVHTFKLCVLYTCLRVCGHICVCRMKQLMFFLLIALGSSSGWNCCGSTSAVVPEATERVAHLRQGRDRAGRTGTIVISQIPASARALPVIHIPRVNGQGIALILYILAPITSENTVSMDDGSDD